MGHGRRSWVLVVGGRGLMVVVVAEDGGIRLFVVVGVLVTCVHLGAGVLVCGHPSVGTSLSLSSCLPCQWQRCGTWEVSSEGEGAVESTVGLFTHLWPKTPDSDDVVRRHRQMTCCHVASTLLGLLSLVTWHWQHPLDVVGGAGHG